VSAELRINADALKELADAADELEQAVEGADVRLVMGMAMMEVIKNNFAAIAQDETHHKTAQRLEAAPTGVYEEAGRRTDQPVVESDAVSVTIHQAAIAQRFFGGPIETVNANWLTIPARTESYGKLAGEFDNLRFILFPSGTAALVDRGAPSPGNVYFWLVKHVNQAPDETVLPNEDDILNEVMNRAASYIGRVWSKAKLST